MNKNYLFFLFLLATLLPETLFAQSSSRWTVGIGLGVNYSNSSEDTAPLEKECPVLPRIGVSLEYNVWNNLYMQSGVIYSMKGLKSSGDTENLKASVKLDQQVMQIPVLLNYKFTIGKFRMGTGAGGYYSYGIGGKTKAVGQVNGQDVNIKVNTFGNILRKNDVGLIFNLSTRLQHIALGLSYELGLLEVGIKNVLGQPLGYKNRVASVTVGYIF